MSPAVYSDSLGDVFVGRAGVHKHAASRDHLGLDSLRPQDDLLPLLLQKDHGAGLDAQVVPHPFGDDDPAELVYRRLREVKRIAMRSRAP